MNSKYFSFIKTFYSELNESSQNYISDKLLSPFQLELPYSILDQASSLIRALYNLRENRIYQSRVLNQSNLTAKWDPGNKSLCMSYDFHINSDGQLKLIEVNTNAAFLLMGHFLYQFKNLPYPVTNFSLDELHLNFLEEHYLNQFSDKKKSDQIKGEAPHSLNPNIQNTHSQSSPIQSVELLKDKLLENFKPLTIAIVDEAPSSQKLYFEFLLYQQFLKQYGHSVLILDPSELELTDDLSLVTKDENQFKIDFIYNRTTDFYLEHSVMEPIKLAYLNNKVTLSPNPHEYALLADKQRLIEWSLELKNPNQYNQELIKSEFHFLNTQLLTEENSAFIWTHKKKFFIKPLTSFGSKGSYRGEGISKGLFDQLIGKKFLAQEFCPAAEKIFSSDSINPIKLKYDLRFYVYKAKIQSVVARLYQGQLTNLKTPYGGFAPVIFGSK